MGDFALSIMPLPEVGTVGTDGTKPGFQRLSACPNLLTRLGRLGHVGRGELGMGLGVGPKVCFIGQSHQANGELRRYDLCSSVPDAYVTSTANETGTFSDPRYQPCGSL